jgi:hypothetical protein
MPQDDRSSQTLQESAVQTVSESAPAVVSPWGALTESGGLSAQSYADRLMDDLFTGMEESLERGSTLSNEIVQPEPPVASANQLQQMVLAAFQQRRQAEVAQLDDARSGVSDLVAAATSPAPPSAPPAPLSTSSSGFDRFLWVMGGVALTATGALWVATRSFNSPPPVAQAPVPPTVKQDNAFGDYVRQSLQAIAAKAPFPGSPVTNATPNGTMPSVAVSPGASTPTTASSPKRPATGLSRMVPPAPLPQVGTQTAPAAPGFMASGTPLPPGGGAATAGVVRSLVGVMQLGDRSAALIETNGIAQRIRVGESIGSSGWTLVDVSKDQAVIRRNGEVRSIFIGQTF